MAKVIYGVCGEGFGHSSRAQLIGRHLLDAGHDVIFAGSFRSLLYLREHFGDRVHEVFGLLFFYHRGRVNPLITVLKNIQQAPRIWQINRKVFRDVFQPFAPDLVISDFDPSTAYWAWRNKVPLLSIDNEHVLTDCHLDHPPHQKLNRFNAELVTKAHCFAAQHYGVLSFFDVPAKHDGVSLIPPVIRREVSERTPSDQGHIIIYTTTGYGREQLTEQLNKFKDHRFHIYNYGEPGEAGNCIFKPRSTDGFLDDLAGCHGVIASAGFSLISECLVYRKRMMMLPVPGQYEQIVNAHYMERLGLGLNAGQLTPDNLRTYLDSLDKPLSEGPGVIWPDNQKCFDHLDKLLQKMGLA